MFNKLDKRTVGNRNLSIGTDLALEAFREPDNGYFDKDRKFKEIDISVSRGVVIYINALTLLRNILHASDTKTVDFYLKKNDVRDIVAILIQEIYILSELNDMKFILFIPNYKDIISNLIPRKPNVPPYKKDMIIKFLLNAMSKIGDQLPIDSIRNTYKLPKGDKAYILTHVIHDLNNYKYIKDLRVIESHTSNVLTYKDFGKKYPKLSGHDMSYIPVTEYGIYVFGDGLFGSNLPRSIRVAIYEKYMEKFKHSYNGHILDRVIKGFKDNESKTIKINRRYT